MRTVPRTDVMRGGYWNNSDTDCMVTYRIYFLPTYRESYMGFRLVRDLN